MKAAEQAYAVLHRGIIEGQFSPGERLTESEVADRAGVSRTPVREAMRKLEVEGLLRFVPNQGAFVAAWSEDEVDEIFELRALLEGHAARLCASRARDEDIQELRQLAEAQLAASRDNNEGRLERIAELNGRFHRRLISAAGSGRLGLMLAGLAEAPMVLQTFRDYSRDELVRSAAHHLEIVDAISARDAAWADSVMRSHVFAARQVFEKRRLQT
jgi:DNA-binding GntR family transcriptional regulator